MIQLGTGIRGTCLAHHKVVSGCPICHSHLLYTLWEKHETKHDGQTRILDLSRCHINTINTSPKPPVGWLQVSSPKEQR